MNALVIVIGFKIVELTFQIDSAPEEDMVQILSAYGTDQTLHKRVRYGHMRYRFDLAHLQDPEIRLPLMGNDPTVLDWAPFCGNGWR